MRYEEKAKLTAAKLLVPLGILAVSPVLLVAGAPLRHRYLRYLYRDGAPLVLDKKHGQITVHWFVVSNFLFLWLCWPTEAVARLLARRGRARGRGRA
ncbi:hypothetical protein AB0Q95_04725 [Streptomyces sp. NPDC059900]|uniref:hypothetical protein n=1 Tax=Streptomyces sp. NPDC059900 TaxID=3155816 RepID=UPI0034285393